jgi:predicted AAA+ superfamily ATPase
MAHEYAKAAGGEIFFWKDGSREIDIVLSVENTLLPISVNYQLEYSDRCVKSLKVFKRMYGAKNALIITKDVLKIEDGIFFIPYWMI